MQDCRCTNLGRHRPTTARRAGNLTALHWFSRLLDAQRFDELIEEQRYPVLELGIACFRGAPLSDLQPASVDQVGPIRSKEIV